MKRRDFFQATGGALVTAALSSRASKAQAKDASRPNILWITCEDISPHLGCYGDPEATTPNLDALATGGVRYERAFSVSGVCAPSRSCLITGMYPSSLGTHHMRCKNQPPDHVKCFPEYLQAAGYYCTNNRKEDYNFNPPPGAWNESSGNAHFRNRPDKDQPFFAVFNFIITHESKIGTLPEDLSEDLRALLPKEHHDPAKANLPPYYPDTPVIRRHWAHYYDLITAMDSQAGDLLRQLEEDGLAENTVVFFFGDHGVGLPWAKRWMYDRGTRVPFIVRWPGNLEPQSVSENLVSFVDFAPTVLSIAGVPIPEHMQGKPFLGEQTVPPREYIYSARDRMDERYDIIRAVRDKRYKYIRNYEPDRPYDTYLTYPESFPVMQEMRRVQKAGELKGPETLFFQQRKPLEELYDVAADPHEIQNLAELPEFSSVLSRMRGAMEDWFDEIGDQGCIPEIDLEVWRKSGGKWVPDGAKVVYARLPRESGDTTVFGKSINEWIDKFNGNDRLARLRAIKSLGLAGKEVVPTLLDALKDPDASVAFWAGVSLGNLGDDTQEIRQALQWTLGREEASARLGAAGALCKLGHHQDALETVLAGMRDENEYARLYASQILEMLAPGLEEVRQPLEAAREDKNQYVVRIAERALSLWE